MTSALKRDRALVISMLALVLAISCSASGAREGSATPPLQKAQAAPAPAQPAGSPTQFREGLAGVDFTGLDAAGKNRALDVMNSQLCDCGCGMTIAQCRVQDKNCGRSPNLARMIIDNVKAGKSNQEIVAALKAGTGAAAAPPPQPSGPVTIDMDGAQVKGNAKAAATLVEFADFQCPFCARATPVVDQILAKYPQDLKFVFKQFPLTQIHHFAEPAARASLAAARQGKFWQMYAVLFQNNRALDDASLKKYAQDMGLDMQKFEHDFGDPAIAQAVQKEATEAVRLGVNGTPTFFINGVQVPSWDIDTMSKMVEAAKSGGDVSAAVAEIRKQIADQQAAARQAQLAQQAAMANQVIQIDITGAPIKGDPKAPVTIVEFGDFQCPYCANAQPLIKQVLDAYSGKVKLAFKQLPLISIHPNARPAALAALEALEQGKFWEMHDLLYQNYSRLDRQMLSNLATQAGLNSSEFEKSMQTEEHKAQVDKELADAQRYGVNSTPTFFVNGKRVMTRDFDTFKRMIDEALSSAGSRASS